MTLHFYGSIAIYLGHLYLLGLLLNQVAEADLFINTFHSNYGQEGICVRPLHPYKGGTHQGGEIFDEILLFFWVKIVLFRLIFCLSRGTDLYQRFLCRSQL
jgi:hypothetical protein